MHCQGTYHQVRGSQNISQFKWTILTQSATPAIRPLQVFKHNKKISISWDNIRYTILLELNWCALLKLIVGFQSQSLHLTYEIHELEEKNPRRKEKLISGKILNGSAGKNKTNDFVDLNLMQNSDDAHATTKQLNETEK